MKIGVVYPQTELNGDPAAVRRIGLAVEELGYDHIVAYDHVVGALHAAVTRRRVAATPWVAVAFVAIQIMWSAGFLASLVTPDLKVQGSIGGSQGSGRDER